MIASLPPLNEVRQILSQDTAIPALRAVLFLIGALTAWAWVRGRPVLAVLWVWTGGCLGLAYWLIQMVSPMGFETDAALTRAWAQAGVNAGAEPRGQGFVWGTEPEASLVSTLAASRLVSMDVVFVTPQLADLLSLGLLVGIPFMFTRSRSTAAFAAVLAAGSGLWPGLSPYGAILHRPSSLLVIGILLLVLVAMARGIRLRRAFHRHRLSASLGLVVTASLVRSMEGGTEPGVGAVLLLSGAAIALASPLRAAVRILTFTPIRARRAEALLLLCVFTGSGLFWWTPAASVAGYDQAREPNTTLLKPLEWVRHNVPPEGVVLASPGYSAPIAAFGGRRVLFPIPGTEAGDGLSQPFRRARLAETARSGQPVARLAEAFSVTHLLLGPGETDPGNAASKDLSNEPRLRLVLEYQDAKDFRVFRLATK